MLKLEEERKGAGLAGVRKPRRCNLSVSGQWRRGQEEELCSSPSGLWRKHTDPGPPSPIRINDSQGRPRVACIEDTFESGDCSVAQLCTHWMKWREKKVIVCQDKWDLSATWGKTDVDDFYPEAQWVSPGTSQSNPLWQFERKTGRTWIKIKENGTRWLNGRWAAGAVLQLQLWCPFLF